MLPVSACHFFMLLADRSSDITSHIAEVTTDMELGQYFCTTASYQLQAVSQKCANFVMQ